MTLGDLFQKLSYGELQNLTIGNDGSGTILDSAKPRITNYTNEALLRLYSRFVLKENDLILMPQSYITFYHLLPKFAVSYVASGAADDEPVRYILDMSAEPFQDEVLRILSVTNQVGDEFPLNDPGNWLSLYTPQAKVLQVPNPIQDSPLSVCYQQRHTEIQGDLNEGIFCPDVLVKALTSYIAYQVFDDMNSVDSSAKAQNYLAKYEAICAEVVDRDLVGSSTSQTNTRFECGGWV
jgi:hypothetical protein